MFALILQSQARKKISRCAYAIGMSRTFFQEETLLQGREPTMLGVIFVVQAQHEKTPQSLRKWRGKYRSLEAGIQLYLGLSKAF